MSANPILVDEKRRSLQQKQEIVFKHWRAQNKVVSDFLFKNADEPLNLSQQHRDTA